MGADLAAGGRLSRLVAADSEHKLEGFLQELRSTEAAFNWELNLLEADIPAPFTFAGSRSGDDFLVVAAVSKGDMVRLVEQLLSMNNELVTTIRSLQKLVSNRETVVAPAQDLGQMMQLNNDLVNVQRELTRKNNELTESRKLVQSILDTTPDIIYIFDVKKGRNVYSNRGIERILGYTPAEVRSMSSDLIEKLMHPDEFSAYPEHLAALKSGDSGTVVEWEYRMRSAAGEWRWLRSRETVFERDVEGTPSQILGTASDITQQRIVEAQLRQMSIVDELTGLYNRRGLDGLATQAIAHANRSGQAVGVVFADIDGLKLINDRFGHVIGDVAIREAGLALRSIARQSDIAARLGGDEFALVVLDATPEGIERVIERIGQAVDEFNARSADKGWTLSLSVGYSLSEVGGQFDFEDIMNTADEQMYAAKRSRKGRS